MGNRDRISRHWRAALGLAVSLTLAGCSVASPTPQIIYVTAPPTPIIIYVTPPPPTPTLTLSPEPTPTATPTPTPTPTPSPTSPAAACTGTASNKAFFAQAAAAMSWTVYCAVLPSGWSLTKGEYDKAPNGYLYVGYQGPGGAGISLWEGNLCGPGGYAMTCGWIVVAQGPASFGGLSAELYLHGPYFLIDANPGTPHEYMIQGAGLTRPTFVACAAAMRAIPKP